MYKGRICLDTSEIIDVPDGKGITFFDTYSFTILKNFFYSCQLKGIDVSKIIALLYH